jgi:uncharacterized OB-fold protein
MSSLQGIVQSHTIIRVADKAHAAMAPYVLLLVDIGGKRVLGYFDDAEPPRIGARVTADAKDDETPMFSVLEENS